eukprot:UN04408
MKLDQFNLDKMKSKKNKEDEIIEETEEEENSKQHTDYNEYSISGISNADSHTNTNSTMTTTIISGHNSEREFLNEASLQKQQLASESEDNIIRAITPKQYDLSISSTEKRSEIKIIPNNYR